MSLLQYKTKDYYKILDVPETANHDEIKSKFFHLAHKYHPDVNHEPGAADKFKEFNEAFQVVGNEDERKIYNAVRNSTKISADHFAKTSAASTTPPPQPAQSTPTGQPAPSAGGYQETAYDRTQTGDFATQTPKPEFDKEAYNKETEQIKSYRRKLIRAAIARITVMTILFMFFSYLYVILIEVIAWSVVGLNSPSWQTNLKILLSPAIIQEFLLNFNTIGSLVSGLIMGAIFGIDLNFKIETFITNTRMKKTYHLLRTLLFTFGFAFLFVLLNVLLSTVLRQEILWLKITLLVLGLLIGSTISSDGNFIVRVKTKAGWRELFFIFMRNLGFGFLGALLGGLLGLILTVMFPEAQQNIYLYMPLTGFALLTALGSTSEEEISNMVKEIDQVTKKMIFIVSIFVMLAVGLVGGFFLRNVVPM